MKVISRLFFLFFMLISLNKPVLANEDGSFHLVVFGDSLSNGYSLPQEKGFTAVLQETLHQKGFDNISVLNASVSGDTTANGLSRIDEVLDLSPHAVILELGINDVLNGVNFKESEANLDKILQIFQQHEIPVLLIGMRAPFLTNQINREEFIGMYKRMAKKY